MPGSQGPAGLFLPGLPWSCALETQGSKLSRKRQAWRSTAQDEETENHRRRQMSVYRRGETYWYEFWFANRRIRESVKTKSKTVAKEAEKKRRRELEEGYNGMATEDRSRRVLTFSQAAGRF